MSHNDVVIFNIHLINFIFLYFSGRYRVMKEIVAFIFLTALSSGAQAQLDPACDAYKRRLEEMYRHLPAAEAARTRAMYDKSLQMLAGRPATEQREECLRGAQGLTQGFPAPQPDNIPGPRDADPDTITTGRDPDPSTINRGRDVPLDTINTGRNVDPGTINTGHDVDPDTINTGRDVDPATINTGRDADSNTDILP